MQNTLDKNNTSSSHRWHSTRSNSSQKTSKIICAWRDYLTDDFVSFDCHVTIDFEDALKRIEKLSSKSCSYIGFKNIETSETLEFVRIKLNHWVVFPGKNHPRFHSIQHSQLKKFRLGVNCSTNKITYALKVFFEGRGWEILFDWKKRTKIVPEKLVATEIKYGRGF